MLNASSREPPKDDIVVQRELTPQSDRTEDSESSVAEGDAGVNVGEDVVDCPGPDVQRSLSSSRVLKNGGEESSGKTFIQDVSKDRRKRSNSLPSHFFPPGGLILESAQVRQSTFEPWTNTIVKILQACFIALVSFFLFKFNLVSSPVEQYQQSDFQKDLHEIGEKYDIKDGTMLLIQSGIETTFRKQDTLSMVFLYNDENTNNIDEADVKEFVNKVAAVSAKFLRNETNTASPILVKNSDLNVETVGELINKYEGNLKDNGVLIVQDLEDIPVNLAMAFHYYCDEYDPLVKKTAVFFTLNLSKCTQKDGKTDHEVVESCLKEKWSRLAKEKLTPLLTRVVNVVVDLESERR